jgi:hypothetical protein
VCNQFLLKLSKKKKYLSSLVWIIFVTMLTNLICDQKVKEQ